jgi:hypothetical protein
LILPSPGREQARKSRNSPRAGLAPHVRMAGARCFAASAASPDRDR